MMSAAGSSKRRRIASPPFIVVVDRGGGADDAPPPRSLSSLPDAPLAYVASFLSKPSRALFAAAMTAPSSSWTTHSDDAERRAPSSTSRAILGSLPSERWDVLDFADAERSLVEKIADDDVAAILACIDAARNLTTLKLTGCVNITGRGLEPLRGSSVIAQIDLSLSGRHEVAEIDPKPAILETVVLPILDSIVDSVQNSLKHLQFPKKWRDDQLVELDAFMRKYDQMLERRGPSCSNCRSRLDSEDGYVGQIDQRRNSLFYGLQISTCYKCMNLFCYECYNEDGHVCNNFCAKCDRNCCLDCVETAGVCDKCEANLCSGCTAVHECRECGEDFCNECGPQNICECWDGPFCRECSPNYFVCQSEWCDAERCGECCDEDAEDAVLAVDCCPECDLTFCTSCRVVECSRERPRRMCSGCIEIMTEKSPWAKSIVVARNKKTAVASLIGELEKIVKEATIKGQYTRTKDVRDAKKEMRRGLAEMRKLSEGNVDATRECYESVLRSVVSASPILNKWGVTN